MSGNVWEWCWDWYDANYYDRCEKQGIVKNPDGAVSSNIGRVVRGGSWNDVSGYCRVAFRFNGNPDFRNDNNGFRVVFVP